MQDKINQFLKLQKIDIEIAEFEKSFENLPKEISAMETVSYTHLTLPTTPYV